MNSGRTTGRAKHRQAFGGDAVSRHVKLHLEMTVNRMDEGKKRVDTGTRASKHSSVLDLMKSTASDKQASKKRSKPRRR